MAAILLACPSPAQTPLRYTITNLGTLNNLDSADVRAFAINASGTVVGRDGTDRGAAKPFIYSGGVMTELPSLNALTNMATGINAAGTVVGTSSTFDSGFSRGFIVSGGVVTDLGPNTTAVAINDSGTVAGLSSNRPYVRSAGGNLTFLPAFAKPNTTPNVSAINAAGTVVGDAETNDGVRAFAATAASIISLGVIPGGSESYASGINAAGVIVGSAFVATDRALVAVIYSGGNIINIDPAGAAANGISSGAAAINSAGTVVGSNSANRAFVYTQATGMVDLETVVTNFATSGFTRLIEAVAINDAGQIVGHGSIGPGRRRAFILNPVAVNPGAPVITTHPQPQTVAAGGTATFSVAATGSGLGYEWRFNTTPIAGATSQTYTQTGVTAARAGSYSVRVFNSAGSVTSNTAALTVTPAPPPPASGRLINLSILTSLAGTADSFTMGYVVGGAGTSGAKPLVIRAAGPSLTPLGVGGALADPRLELFAGPAASGTNDNWGGGANLAAAMNAVGAFAFVDPASLDAAVATNVAAGDNSVKVSPVGNLSGQVIAEIYDATPTASFSATTPRLINVSVLKNIGTGLTAGFVIGGAGSRTVLIRAVGPTLGAAPFNVPGVVADPQLTLFAGQTQIGTNDNWGGGAALSAAFTQVGAFPLPAASRDAALLTTLAPGQYSVRVTNTGSNTAGATGVALVEVYEVP